jgi:hypothetical protein
MPFPSSPVLDTFTDPSAPRNLSAYSSVWSGPALSSDAGINKTTVSGGAGGTQGSAYRNDISLANCEVFATITVKPDVGSASELIARVTNPGASLDCFALVAFNNAGTDTIEVYDFSAGVGSSLALVQTAEFSVGDQFGMSVIGNTITLYKNGAQIGSPVTSALHPGAGSIGIRLGDANATVDDFGGGAPGSLTGARPQFNPIPFM